MNSNKYLKSLIQTIKKETKGKTNAYTTQATVKRVEGNTAWLHIPGGVSETPVELTINAKVGDTVKVSVSGGRAWITGNATAPPTDDTKAKAAQVKADKADIKAKKAAETADDALQTADDALQTADDALQTANSTNQYFWNVSTGSDTGAHITEIPQDEFLENPTGGNLLARSNGIQIRQGLAVLASLLSNGITIGETAGIHLVIDTGGIEFFNGASSIMKIKYILGSGDPSQLSKQGQNTLSYLGFNDAYTSVGAERTTYRSGADRYLNLAFMDMDAGNNNAFAGLAARYQEGDEQNTKTAEIQLDAASGESEIALISDKVKLGSALYNSSGTYPFLAVDTVTAPASITKSSYNSGNVSISKTGYTPVGIIGLDTAGSYGGYVNIYDYYIDGSALYWAGRNINTSNDYSGNLVFYVLFVISNQDI